MLRALLTRHDDSWADGLTLTADLAHMLLTELLKTRKEKTTPFGVNLMRSRALYRGAQNGLFSNPCQTMQAIGNGPKSAKAAVTAELDCLYTSFDTVGDRSLPNFQTCIQHAIYVTVCASTSTTYSVVSSQSWEHAALFVLHTHAFMANNVRTSHRV